MKMKIGFLFFILVQLSIFSPTEGLTWRSQPASATGIQGQTVSMTWTAGLGVGETWTFVKVYQRTSQADTKHDIIKEFRTTGRYLYPEYASRDADLNLTASLTGTLLTSVFTMKNLNRSTDERLYYLQIVHTTAGGDSDDSTDLRLTVLVPTTITSPNPSTVTVNETQPAQLECTATGNPAPSINWTRDGVIVGTGSPYTTPPVTPNDDKACYYTCVAYNGILDVKTANFCLNVQYKPKNATILSDRSTVCQNDKVNLTCTSGPANPAPSSYEFYDNGVLVGTSASNVYEAKATAGLPSVNKFVCVPRNLLGTSLENGSVEVTAKDKPHLTNLTSTKTEACLNDSVTLQCTTTANPPAHEYRFYLNDQLVHTSMSGIYQLNVPQAGNNTYKCEPKNTVGAGQNKSVTISTKVSPIIVNTSPSQEIRKGSSHTLYCNVEAQGEDINVTWHKVASGQVSSTGVYTIPSVTHADSGSYECRAKTGNECEVKSTMITLTVISPPIISNIIVTEDSLTVTWNNLVLPHNTIATCLIYVMQSFHGVNWMTSSNTSNEDSITCSIAGLKSSTLYRIQYFLQIHKNYVNGTIYIGTSAKVNRTGASSNHSTYDTGKAGNISCGVSSTIFAAVIAVAIVVIVLLILVIVWMRFQGIQNDKRVKRQEKNQTEVSVSQSFSTPSFDTKTVYENEGFISRQTKPDADMALYEQVQNRDRVMNQGVVGPPSFPMEYIPGRQARHETENQVLSQLKEPSYQALDQREMAGTKGVDVNEGSYGHLLGFTRSPDNTTAAALPQDQNPYQAMQPENQSKQYQSLQNMHKPTFNV